MLNIPQVKSAFWVSIPSTCRERSQKSETYNQNLSIWIFIRNQIVSQLACTF